MKTCPIGSCPRLDSCCWSSWFISPPLWFFQCSLILSQSPWRFPSLSHDSHCRHHLWLQVCCRYLLLLSFLLWYTHTIILRPSWILSGATRVSRKQKSKTRKVKPVWIYWSKSSEWQWHELGHMQVCTLTHTRNHASIPPLSFLQARCPFCCPTNSVKALRALW